MLACILCALERGDLPARILYSDAEVMAVRDVANRAPVHFIVFPRQHLGSLAEAQRTDIRVLGHLAFAAAEVMRGQRDDHGGWQATYKVGPAGGQTLPHLTLEVLAGKHPPPPRPPTEKSRKPARQPARKGGVLKDQATTPHLEPETKPAPTDPSKKPQPG
jgi:histidine triad (HIT) family protein